MYPVSPRLQPRPQLLLSVPSARLAATQARCPHKATATAPAACPTRPSHLVGLSLFGVPLRSPRPPPFLHAPLPSALPPQPPTCGLGHCLEKDTVPNTKLQALLGRPQVVEAEVEDGEEVRRRQGHHGAQEVAQRLHHAEPEEGSECQARGRGTRAPAPSPASPASYRAETSSIFSNVRATAR